jgi:hypothetical protein
MGWERKRGKLEQFNAALRGELGPSPPIVGDVAQLRGVRYVIVLDSDTQLPRDAARELVGTMAHPLNRPRFDAALGRVVAATRSCSRASRSRWRAPERSRFARLFAGDTGHRPVHARRVRRLPGRVRRGLVRRQGHLRRRRLPAGARRQAAREPRPQPRPARGRLRPRRPRQRRAPVRGLPDRYAAEVSRRHRWTRGDWQLAAWLLRPGARRRGRARRATRSRALALEDRSTTCAAAWCRWPCSPCSCSAGPPGPGRTGDARGPGDPDRARPARRGHRPRAPTRRAPAPSPPPRHRRRAGPAARARGVRPRLPAPRRLVSASAVVRAAGACASAGAICSSGAPRATPQRGAAAASAPPTASCVARRSSRRSRRDAVSRCQPTRCRWPHRSRSPGCSDRRWRGG